jgi:hypothetical protein
MPVLLADVEGFAYKEIAEMLDIPIGTVMSRLHRGRKGMHKRLFDFAQARGLILPDPEHRTPVLYVLKVQPARNELRLLPRRDLAPFRQVAHGHRFCREVRSQADHRRADVPRPRNGR